MAKQEFRGLDYNKIKEEYIDMTKDELEEKLCVLVVRAQKANNEGDMFKAIELMTRIAIMGEIAGEIGGEQK